MTKEGINRFIRLFYEPTVALFRFRCRKQIYQRKLQKIAA